MTQKEGSQILLTARKEGTVYLSISLRGHESMGTTVLRLEVEPLTPAFAYPVPHDNVYTGEPIIPGCDVRSSQNITLTEGRDYTLGYENNILCGIADLLVYPADETDGEIRTNFMILPQKAEISGLTAADGRIRVTVADQWATGIGGYEIEYRKEGEENWQTVTLTDGQTETELPEAESGVVYEVRARATVDGIMPIIQLPTPCYGEYSDTATVTVP